MASDELGDLLNDLLYADRFGLLDDPVGGAARRAVELGIVDPLVCEIIQQPVRRHKIAQAFAGPVPLPKLHRGNVVLGFDVNGQPIRVPCQYLNGHSMTVGGSGSGKTTKSYWLVLQIAPLVLGLWLFDFRKQEFAVLRPLVARLGIELSVIPARALRVNPLQVPTGVDPADWASRAADMLVMVFELPPRASKLLQTSLLDLYRSFGVFDGRSHFPILAELRDLIANDAQANPQAKLAILDAFGPLLKSIGGVLQYRIGWTTDDLARRKLVFEFGGISEADKNFLLSALIVPEFARRIATGVSNSAMDLFICCDEAARLVRSAGSGAISDLIGLVRGTGVGLDLSVQSADVAPAVLSNTANKFIGRCGSATDYDAIGAAMGLSADQRRSLPYTLTPGWFVGQVGEGDWRHPFLCKVPRITLDKIRRGMASSPPSGGQDAGHSRPFAELLALPTVLASEHADGVTRQTQRASASPDPSGDNARLSEAELRYLRTVVDYPGQPSSAYPRLARIGTRRAQEIRSQLVRAGLLREHPLQTAGRGRSAIVLEPTEAARRVIVASSAATGGQQP